MIDFKKINGFDSGKRDSFESLVKILAKREPPGNGLEYQPNDGRGGDGGVEALWILTDGNKVGYQSKYFETLGGPQWAQIDKSVDKALKAHPELIKYVVVMPLDLTPDRGPKVTGKSQQEKWDESVNKWKAMAAGSSIKLEFELWDSTALNDKLISEGNAPLREHYFGDEVLGRDWFAQHVDYNVLKLDSRFNPGDHVEVQIESMFDVITRGASSQSRLHLAFKALSEAPIPTMEFATTTFVPDAIALTVARECWGELVATRSAIDLDPGTSWDWISAQGKLDRLRRATWDLERQLDPVDENRIGESDIRKFERTSRQLEELAAATNACIVILRESSWRAEAAGCALIFGEAGSGKSHTLGQVAVQRLEVDLLTIIVLGQDLADAPFWPQLGGLLGVTGATSDGILGLLNTIGERKSERILLLFDAINEGVGAGYWMRWMPEVVQALSKYPYIAAVFTCRDVYARYAVPESLLDTLPTFEIHGFVTPDERERAAIQYLDRKGISRPNTPWLSPEFSNPLFLKSTSEAIDGKGETEFPRGFQGISELMSLYLDGLCARIGVLSVRAEDISISLRKYVRDMAVCMANNGQDHVAIDKASQMASEHFGSRQPPEGKTWLDVFVQANLFRRDLPPYLDIVDPLNPPSDLIRFSFQRFQDFLMADALVDKVVAINAIGSDVKMRELVRWVLAFLRTSGGGEKQKHGTEFHRLGPLNFIFHGNDPHGDIRYEYAGLIGSLSIIYPEKLGLEFAKSLPDWETQWERGGPLQSGFGESFKWRKLANFTDDTRELLYRLDEYFVDPQSLMLEVSMTAGHPYNAKHLHGQLKNLELAERDSLWTRWVNWNSREELSQVNRIVSWALTSCEYKIEKSHVQLASLVLAWSLSSSHKTLRDRATKALTTLFLNQANVFKFVLDKMYDCDDPYIIERLYAAAFGACCIDPTLDRLKLYSQMVFARVFADGKPPVALLTRDYALGIIELAASKKYMDDSVLIKNCYHPFGSDEPIFALTEKQVEAIAEQCGDKSIFYSASSGWGDYGKYSIPGRVGKFLTTRLTTPAPVSASDIKERFEEEVIRHCPERVEALGAYRAASRVRFAILPAMSAGKDSKSARRAVELYSDSVEKNIPKEDALSRLEEMLDAEEKKRLTDEYVNDAGGHGEYGSISVDKCRLWITQRAYELGWTSNLFPNDGHGSSSSRYENDLERIGKKYQRIALDELQARLADNFWTLEGWPERPHRYRYSHHEYRRNIEPTILPIEKNCLTGAAIDTGWISEPEISLPEIPESSLKQWPFAEDLTSSMSDKLVRVDENDKRWLVLYEFNKATRSRVVSDTADHGNRYEEFRFFYCVLVDREKVVEFTDSLVEERKFDGSDFEPRSFTDGPYLREAFWRDTWLGEKFSGHIRATPVGCKFAIPVASYNWESHLDKSLPNGFSSYLPQKWFADELSITMSIKGPLSWDDVTGKTVFQSIPLSGNQDVVVIDENTLREYSDEHQVEAVWIMIAERNSWPGIDGTKACRRRSEGVVWHDGESWKQVGWNHDNK